MHGTQGFAIPAGHSIQSLDAMEVRAAVPSDATAIGILHADSWRFAYRGAFDDRFLDQEATQDRLAFWQEKLRSPEPNRHVLILGDGTDIVGFACVYTNHDPEFGSFLNNLHVASNHLRRGHGARLMSAVRECCRIDAPNSPVYLLVLESNLRAQAFYLRFGGTLRQSYPWKPPGGGALQLHQFVWPSPDHIQIDSSPERIPGVVV
jgi:ribosomal protein S18 acetylase RimI-like enzyme